MNSTRPGLPDTASRWAYDTERNRLGWYNNERQYYAANAACRTAAGAKAGCLRITARR